MKKPSATDSLIGENAIVSLPCACANLRRASRIVTQLYDDELRPTGMRATQFTLLQALDRMKTVSQGGLAGLLGLDSTTLTRTLALLRKKGWIDTERGKDRRQVRLALTSEGQRAFKRALPYWLSAQRRLQHALGKTDWEQIIAATIRTAALAPKS